MVPLLWPRKLLILMSLWFCWFNRLSLMKRTLGSMRTIWKLTWMRRVQHHSCLCVSSIQTLISLAQWEVVVKSRPRPKAARCENYEKFYQAAFEDNVGQMKGGVGTKAKSNGIKIQDILDRSLSHPPACCVCCMNILSDNADSAKFQVHHRRMKIVHFYLEH